MAQSEQEIPVPGTALACGDDAEHHVNGGGPLSRELAQETLDANTKPNLPPNEGADTDTEMDSDNDTGTDLDSISESGDDPDSMSESESEQTILDHLRRFHSSHLGKFRECIVNPADLDVTFADVHITKDAVQALDSFFLRLRLPEQFQTGIFAQGPSTGILLYGPPGTGKTQFVKAFAKAASATILTVTGAHFQDHRVGESEKNIHKIFACARAHRGPFVIFIDEADGVFRSRGNEHSTQHHTNDVNQFLTEMDGINSSQLSHVMVIAASNRPFDIDEGVLRRLGRRILVDVPTPYDRQRILEILLKNEVIAEDVEISELARRTPDYTGSDLKNLVCEAALAALRDMVGRKGNSQIGHLGAQTRVLRWRNFMSARERILASPKAEIAEKIRKFHSTFGNLSQQAAEAAKVPKGSHKRKWDEQNV
ncbi:hypothetical protein DRE_06718 [Drechslerella stenobrocha 248]|uniref:AAA+ ATPase domain-containing protein n=1 Tax=Drechslerella stenobrocha 248 TaxID=1043628 RepID=W7HKN1_9PEZI|nr:hypothetical protein DRE_06718 [Drechslerella stenobrocha 248]